MSRIPLALVATALLFSTSPSEARDPKLASYSSDNNRLFWFIHITDTHIGWPVTSSPTLKLIAGEAYKTVKPRFIAITGDLTDMGFMGAYWSSYRSILTKAGHTAKTIFDQPGNHDRWLDTSLSNYKKHSIQGKATGATHHSWTLNLPFGDYQFIGIDTSSGSLPSGEVTYALNALKAGSTARQTIVFGHHPLSVVNSSGTFAKQLAKEKALAYLFGHTHKASTSARSWTKDGLLLWITQTLGKPLSTLGESEYTVVALDNDGLSIRPVALGFKAAGGYYLEWPAVLITTPLDAKLGGTNPYAYPASSVATNNPIRALVFSDTAPSKVTASVDNSSPIALKKVSGSLWEGTFDGKLLGSTTSHTLSVTAVAGSDSDTDTITFKSAASTACSDAVDNDSDKLVDWPTDPGCSGLFDSDETDPPTIIPPSDSGVPDGGPAGDAGDGGAGDTGVGEAGAGEAGSGEVGAGEAGVGEAGAGDSGSQADAGTPDVSKTADAPTPDAGIADGPDADGPAVTPAPSEGCDCSVVSDDGWAATPLLLALVLLVLIRRRGSRRDTTGSNSV